MITLPLDGITVLSLEHAVAAPLCTRHLADQGARVIKIERAGEGDFARRYDERVMGQSSYFVWANRSKESLTLDLKHPQARPLLDGLVAGADVIVQNLAPGAAARLGLSYEALSRRHPRLVVCDISGYGEGGPYRDKKAYDLMVQAEAGLMASTGDAGSMARAGFSAADVSAAMYAYSGILNALLLRERTGQGSHVAVAMLDGLAEWMGNPMYYSHAGQAPPVRTGASHPSIAPYGPVRCANGALLMLGVQNEREWHRLCAQVLDDAPLAADPRFASNSLRVENRDALDAMIQACLTDCPVEVAERRLDAAGIASARIHGPQGLWDHPQLEARGRWATVETPAGSMRALRPPVENNRYAARMDPVPGLGEHTERILKELGCDAERICALRADGVV